jgi:hypothetical protein
LFRRHAKAVGVVVIRTVVEADPAVRANLVAALTGPGAPAGIVACSQHADVVTVRFDDAVSAAELIDDLITIETHFAPKPGTEPLDDEEAARLAAVGLGDPDLDAGRILERRLDATP